MHGRTRSFVALTLASGMLAGTLGWQLIGGSATANGVVAKTFYLHASRPVTSVSEAEEATALGAGPSMDEIAPTGATPKVASASSLGNPAFRKNFLLAYWAAPLTGEIVGPSTLRVYASATVPTTVEARLFGDGGIGVSVELARATAVVSSSAPAPVDIVLPAPPGGGVQEQIVVQLSASNPTPTGLPSPAPQTVNVPAEIKVLFDSADFPSHYAFSVGPLPPPGPKLKIADPTGVALLSTGAPVAGAAETGEVLKLNADGTVASALVFGLVPSHFARGVQGVATDASDNVYYALAEEGEVRFVPSSGSGGGIYARGLGAPGGIAFGPDGTLYVADQAGKRVLTVDAATGAVGTFGPAIPTAPYGIAISPSGGVFVSTPRGPLGGPNNQPTSGRIYEVTASAVTERAQVDFAEGLAFDATGGTLFVGSGRAGKLLSVKLSDASTTELATAKFGPINLTATATDLWVSQQGEGTNGVDRIEKVALPAGVTGFEAYRPSVGPAALAPLSSPAIVHKAGALALDPSAWSGDLPIAAMRSTGIGASEPTIGAASDGTIYYMASDLDTSLIKPARAVVVGAPRPLILKSTDGGLSWADVTERIQGQDLTKTTADPYLYVDPATNRVFNVELYGGCSYIAWTDNAGTSWERNPMGCGVPVNDHQTLAAGPPRSTATDGYPNLVYYCVNQVAVTSCARSLNGGKVFTPAGNAFLGLDPTEPNGPVCGGLAAHVTVGADGYVYVGKGHCGRPAVAVSADDGLTWTKSIISTTVRANQHEISVGTDPSGNVYALFIGTDRLPYLAVSNNHGTSWSQPMMVAPPGVVEVNLPSLAVGDDGRVVVIYQGAAASCCYPTATGTGRNYAKAAWNGYMTITTNALDALAAGGEPLFATTTVNDRHDPLLRGTCGPDRCNAPWNWDFLDVIVGPDGRPWAAFIDSCVALCSSRETVSNNNYIGVATPLVAGPKLRGSGNLSPI